MVKCGLLMPVGSSPSGGLLSRVCCLTQSSGTAMRIREGFGILSVLKHIWFDLDGTLTIQTTEFHAAHDKLRYEAYTKATGLPLDQAKRAYDEAYKQHGSNSVVFSSLGRPSDYWQKIYSTMDEITYFKP